MEYDINYLINSLIEQKNCKFKGNIYHWTQVNFAYNSNKIEGSRLSEEQTEMIYSTHSFITKNEESIKMDDLIEMANHFRLFDYMLDTLDKPLSKELIIEMNKILKRGTTDELNPKYNVGGFKVIKNVIGLINIIPTTAPENVEAELDSLFKSYNLIKNKSLDDIIKFHVVFERIHPFGDGNGRVGRMIMFRECLNNGILPFVIRDIDKNFYIRGLREFDRDPAYLKDTCLHSQDIYESISLNLLGNELLRKKNLKERINEAKEKQSQRPSSTQSLNKDLARGKSH